MNTKIRKIKYKDTEIVISIDGKTVIWNGNQRKIYYNSDGYAVCSIKIPNIGWRSVSVARLVAMAFVPNPYNLPEVNHKDYNRKNANAKNLEWTSHADNVRYSNCNRPDYNGNKNPNYGNHILSERYRANKNLAKEKQGRKGVKNGRARPLALYCNGELIKNFQYVKQCCDYFIENKIIDTVNVESMRCQINRCIRENKLYKKIYKFEYIK